MKFNVIVKEKMLQVEMTDAEWTRFVNCTKLLTGYNVDFSVFSEEEMKVLLEHQAPDPTNAVSKTIKGNFTIPPGYHTPKEVTNATIPSPPQKSIPKPKVTAKADPHPTPRVEKLFPGFKRSAAAPHAVKGLLNIKCDSCKREFITYAREGITEFECKICGAKIVFKEPLKKVEYKCGCGSGGYLHTNASTTAGIKVKCRDCGYTVTNLKMKES